MTYVWSKWWARLGKYVTKLFSYQENLLNVLSKSNEPNLISNFYFGHRFINCHTFSPFCPFSREPDFSQTCGFRNMIEDHGNIHFSQHKSTQFLKLHFCAILGSFYSNLGKWDKKIQNSGSVTFENL